MDVQRLKDSIDTEKRYNEAPEFRVEQSETGDSSTLKGYALVYDRESVPMFDAKRRRQFREIVRPGAIDKSLADMSEIKADYAHESDQILGRRSKGTLRLVSDQLGVFVEIDLPNTTLGRDVAVSVAEDRRDLDKMSFQFKIREGGETWTRTADGWLRELTDIVLERVTVTAEPAYPDTTVALRSLAAIEEQEEKSEAAEGNDTEQDESNSDSEQKPLSYYGYMLDILETE